MDLKFVNLLCDFLPKGKIWENPQGNILKLKHGISDELGRVYLQITEFYADFNILNRSNLANTHALDYGLDAHSFTDQEMQHIIVEYIHKNYTLQQIIEDFSALIGASVEFYAPPKQHSRIGGIKTSFKLYGGEKNMVVWLQYAFNPSTTCIQYQKINYLANFFKPPYVKLTQEGAAPIAIKDFFAGKSRVGSRLGGVETCAIF